MVLFLLSLVTGCDKIDFFKPKDLGKPGASPTSQVKGTIVAKVNNIPITLEELNKDIENYNAMVPADKPEEKITTLDRKVNYLKNDMVRRVLLYQLGLARGIDKKEEVVKALERTKQDLLVIELLRQEAEKVDISSKEIEDYYNTYKDELKEPEERKIREVVVPSEQEAKEILIQLLQGADFATLARDRSKSASAKDGGDLGFMGKNKKFAQFDTVAFSESLDVGKISNIFQGPEGYYILKIEAKRGGKEKSLTEMWDDIKRGLTFLKQQRVIKDLMDKLSSEAKLEFYESQIK